MLADSHANDFNLSQQAKSGKYSDVYFCAASSGTKIKLSTVMRNSAQGSQVSTLTGSSKVSGLSHFHFTWQLKKKIPTFWGCSPSQALKILTQKEQSSNPVASEYTWPLTPAASRKPVWEEKPGPIWLGDSEVSDKDAHRTLRAHFQLLVTWTPHNSLLTVGISFPEHLWTISAHGEAWGWPKARWIKTLPKGARWLLVGVVEEYGRHVLVPECTVLRIPTLQLCLGLGSDQHSFSQELGL